MKWFMGFKIGTQSLQAHAYKLTHSEKVYLAMPFYFKVL
jgi:hypothetical protein